MTEQFLHLSKTEVVNLRHIIRAERTATQVTFYLVGAPNNIGVPPSKTVALKGIDDRLMGELHSLFGATEDDPAW